MSKQTFSIWLLPIDSDHNYLSKIIQSLSEEHDAPFFQPHCTLFSSFSDIYSAKKIIDQLNLDSFDLDVRRISQSSDIWKTVFIELKNSSQLQNLNCLLKGLKDEDYLFSPHISLIYKLLDVNKLRLALPVTFPVTFPSRFATIDPTVPETTSELIDASGIKVNFPAESS